MRGLLVSGVGFPLGFGSTYNHLAPHEGLIVENFDRSFCLVDRRHFDEPITLGPMGIPVVDNLDTADCTNPLEKFFQFVFGCVVGQVAKIEPVGFDIFGRRCFPPAGRARCFGDSRSGLWRLAGLFSVVPG